MSPGHKERRSLFIFWKSLDCCSHQEQFKVVRRASYTVIKDLRRMEAIGVQFEARSEVSTDAATTTLTSPPSPLFISLYILSGSNCRGILQRMSLNLFKDCGILFLKTKRACDSWRSAAWQPSVQLHRAEVAGICSEISYAQIRRTDWIIRFFSLGSIACMNEARPQATSGGFWREFPCEFPRTL